jgi:hypothetical protein
VSRSSGSKWRKMAHFGRSFGPFRSARRRSGTGRYWGMAELRSLERKRLICQALGRGILPVSKPTSGLGSRVSDRLSDRGIHASNVRSPGEGPVGHHASKGGRFVRREASASKGGRFFSKGGHLRRVLPSKNRPRFVPDMRSSDEISVHLTHGQPATDDFGLARVHLD